MVRCQNTLYPDYPTVVEEYVTLDRGRDPKCKTQRFNITIRVLPDYQRRGVGTALWHTIKAALEQFNPLSLRAVAREDQPYAMGWLEKHGFVDVLRDQRSRLTGADFDPAPFVGMIETLAAQGIVIKTYNDLAHDPDRDQQLYRLEMLIAPDVSGSDNFTAPGFAYYEKNILQAATQPKDAYFVAVTDRGEYVGLSNLWIDRASDMLYTGLTGVRRDYRRKGLATALKLRGIEYARHNGNSHINADNAATNPMLQLNYRLGFRPTPAWVIYKKQVREDAARA